MRNPAWNTNNQWWSIWSPFWALSALEIASSWPSLCRLSCWRKTRLTIFSLAQWNDKLCFFLWGFAAVSAVSSQAWEQFWAQNHGHSYHSSEMRTQVVPARRCCLAFQGSKNHCWRGGSIGKREKRRTMGPWDSLGFLGALNVDKPIQNEQKRCQVEWLPWSKPASGSTHVPTEGMKICKSRKITTSANGLPQCYSAHINSGSWRYLRDMIEWSWF